MQRAPRKYRNKPTETDGYTFASRKEARRYQDLTTLARQGVICNLLVHPGFSLDVNGCHIGRYVADFQYEECATGLVVTEDVKSRPTCTPVYQLKKKLVKALYNIDVVEV